MSFSGDKSYYEIVAADLQRSIRKGDLGPGDMLESENALSRRYATSRVTVRKSLALLEKAGYVKPRRGKGYFVCEPAHQSFSFKFVETPDGFETSYHYIHAMRADERVSAELGLALGQMVLGICRIISKDGRPVAVDYKFIPHEKGKPLIESEIDYAILPDIAAAKAGPFAIHTVMEIGAEMPDEEVCVLLGCTTNVPVLAIRRRLADLDGNPVGYGVRYQLQEFGSLYAISGYEVDHAKGRESGTGGCAAV